MNGAALNLVRWNPSHPAQNRTKPLNLLRDGRLTHSQPSRQLLLCGWCLWCPDDECQEKQPPADLLRAGRALDGPPQQPADDLPPVSGSLNFVVNILPRVAGLDGFLVVVKIECHGFVIGNGDSVIGNWTDIAGVVTKKGLAWRLTGTFKRPC